jgi:hypothetical protein
MKKLILSVFIFTFGFATATHAQQVNTLPTKHLPEAPGKEIEVITVNYAPGAVDAIHRHDAHATPSTADCPFLSFRALGGPCHVVNRYGEVIQTAIKPGARVRVYYVNMGDLRMIDHVVVD